MFLCFSPECGRVLKSTRIVGGENADKNEYPWQVTNYTLPKSTNVLNG